MLPVIEIYDSIDGEGLRAGKLTTFIRLAGCNLRCKYCDTAYAFSKSNARLMPISEILKVISDLGNYYITLTGGEPLIHSESIDLVDVLSENGYHVNIETNGSISIASLLKYACTITMDYKTPASDECEKMLTENVDLLRPHDVLKIVMEKSDEAFVKSLITKVKPKCEVFLSPIFGKYDPRDLVAFLKTFGKSQSNCPVIKQDKIRMQIQLHKVVWDPNLKGV